MEVSEGEPEREPAVARNEAFLTADLPGIGGFLRERPEDFVVVELPSRAPSGKGDYARARIQKHGISTPELQRRIGSALSIPATEVGVAGMKDAVAVAQQWITVPWSKEPKLSAATIKDVTIVEIARDHEALHPGALAGNRFDVTVRGVGDEADALVRANAIAAELQRRGVPHFFGPQRFGIRGETPEIGRLLLRRDLAGALDLYLGAPSTKEGDLRAQAFRRAYDQQRYREALALVPGRLNSERRLLELLVKGRNKEFVAGQLAPATRRMALSAWQAQLFNRLLARRLATLDVATEGDLLLAADGGEARRCSDPAADQPAVTALALHPTAPLFGERVELADGAQGAIERELLAAESLSQNALARPVGLALWGERRPLRFVPRGLKIRALRGEKSLRFEFALPPGCFATAVLGEVMKDCEPVT